MEGSLLSRATPLGLLKRGLRAAVKMPFQAIGLDVVRAVPDPRRWLKRYGFRTVLDIGAHEGQFASKIHRLLPDAAIISFEPLADCYVELRRSMEGVGNFRAVNCALGERNETATIHRSSYSASSSLLTMNARHSETFPITAGSADEQVEVRRLDDAIDAGELAEPILLKMDVQGYEGMVIRGGPRTFARTQLVIVEVSYVELYEGQPLFDDIYGELRSHGLTFLGMIGQLQDPHDGTPLQGDAVFGRREPA